MIVVNKMRRIEGETAFKGLADIIIDGKILIKGIRIVNIQGIMKVMLPDKKTEKGEWVEVIELLDLNLKREINDIVLAEFELGEK